MAEENVNNSTAGNGSSQTETSSASHSEAKEQHTEALSHGSFTNTKFMKEWLGINSLHNNQNVISLLETNKMTFKDLISLSTSDITAFCESIEATFTDKQLLKHALMTLPKPQKESQQLAKEKEFDLLQHELSHRVEAYLTYEVASSLIFGFSVSVLFAETKQENFEEEYLEIVFTIMMNLALLLSAYSLIVISITHYFINRYTANYKYSVASWYLRRYFKQRQYARWSFYTSIICLIIALAVYLFEQLTSKNAIISVATLGSGAIFLVYIMYQMLNPHKFSQSVERKEEAEAVSLVEQLSICLVFRYGEKGARIAYDGFFSVEADDCFENIQLLFEEHEALLGESVYVKHDDVVQLLKEINPSEKDELPFAQFEYWYQKVVCAVNNGCYSWNIDIIEARKHKKSSRKATYAAPLEEDGDTTCRCC